MAIRWACISGPPRPRTPQRMPHSPEPPASRQTIRRLAAAVLLQPDHAGQGKRYLSAARTTITAYADRFRITPFTSLTIVDPGWSRPAGATVPAGDATTVVADTRLLAP